ncbi:MAG: complex I subunit 4 family protein [Acidimicrobiales bacterium]
MAFPVVTTAVALPVVGAAAVVVLPAARAEVAKLVGLLFALAELAAVAYLVVQFRATAGFQFVSDHSWISALGISWHVGVDGISLFLVAMTALLFPIAMAGPALDANPRAFMGWMLLLEAACIGTFVAMDLFLFFVMFEVTLVPGYFLISGWGGLRRSYAALKFFIYTFAGSAFLLVGIVSVWFLTGRAGGARSFDLITVTRAASHLPLGDQELVLLAFVAAFAVKIPLVPFHTWVPDAYTEASTAGSMVLAGILFKLGAYGVLRFGVFVFPRAAIDLAPLLLTLAAIGIIYAAAVAIVQKDLKRLVAYSTVADVGFVVLGVFAFSSQGISGSVLEMVNHGLTTGALFFLVGMIWDRRRTLRISELGGLARPAPVLAGVFILVVMAAVGLPGLNGFVGEFLVLVGTFITHRWWAVAGATGVVLSAVYLLWAYQRVFHGPVAGANAAISDMSWREKGAIAPLLAGIIFLGVYPKPFLDRVTPAVGHLLSHVQAVDPHFAIPVSGLQPAGGHQVYAVPADQVVDGPGARVGGVPAATIAGPGEGAQ